MKRMSLSERAERSWRRRMRSAACSVRVGAVFAIVMLLAACGSSGGGNSQATPSGQSASAPGDTLTLTFQQGTPAFEVKTQTGAHFVQDPSGRTVDLAGSAGATIVLRGFRGDVRNYTGPVSIMSGGPRLLQVYEIGDFEGGAVSAVGLR